MTGLPERDPLADLVARSVGGRVERVVAETLEAPGRERKRLRYERDGGSASAIFERAPRGETLEAQLLPFLARKIDRVPTVYSRGLPPPHAALGPWLLLEDVLDAPDACDAPAEIVGALAAIAAAVARDVPALRALGLTGRDVSPELRDLPVGLVHGALSCDVARRTGRGVVITDWSHAFLGPAILDAVHLAKDFEGRGHRDRSEAVREAWLAQHPDDGQRWRLAGG